jgi:hypothetical protein
MRVPAPLLLVTMPAGYLLRRRQIRKVVDKTVSRQAKQLDAALDRRGLTATPTEADAPTAAAEDSTRGWLYRYRHTLAPIPTAGTLVALRLAWSTWPLGTAVIPAALVLVAGGWWVREIGNEDVAKRRRLAAVLTVAAATLWLVSPARVALPIWPGEVVFWPPGAILDWTSGRVPAPWSWVLTVLASRWLWIGLWTLAAVEVRRRRFRIRAVPAVVVQSLDMSPAGIWSRTVGAEGPLAGTVLTDVHRVFSQDGTDVGWQADAVCTWGKHTATTVKAQRENIVGAYGRDLADFAHDRTGNALVARITLTERDPFPTVLAPKTGLNPDGTFVVGCYADGSDVLMRLYTPGAGTHDFWFFGVKGSGKSTMVDNALGSLMSAGIVVLHLVDLKGGMSLPEWKEIAFRHGKTVADGLAMLRRLDAIGQDRMAAAERLGLKVLEPSAEWPVHLGAIEEAPQLWKLKEAVEIAERIETMYRAVLVSLMSISQMTELQQAWGGSNTLRTQAQAGNVGCGYVSKDQAKLGFDHFDPDMSLIKKGSYHWYVTSPVESREVLLRVAVVDSAEVARRAIPGRPNAVDLAAVKRVEDEMAADAADVAQEAETEAQVKAEGITRETVGKALRLATEEAGGPVRLGAVAEAFTRTDMDEVTRKRVTDTVRKALAKLVEAGTAESPEWGKYGVAS